MDRCRVWFLGLSVAVVALAGCGTSDVSSSGGGGAAGPHVVAVAPTPFSYRISTPFVVTGSGFLNVVGTNATVTFETTGVGTTPFQGGTSATASVVGTIVNDGTIAASSPLATLCDADSFTAKVTVTLPTGAHGTSATPIATFVAPVVLSFAPNPARATISDAFTVTGSGFAPVGGAATVRFSTAPTTPFAGGVSATVEVPATITSDTTVQGMTPLATTEQDFDATVRVLLADGTCSDVATVTFRAGPVVRSVASLPGVIGAAGAPTFLSCAPSTMEIQADNLDAGATALLFATAGGAADPIGTGFLNGASVTVNPGVDVLVGTTPYDPSRTADTPTTVRVTNADGQSVDATTSPVTGLPIVFAVSGALHGTPVITEPGDNAGASVAVDPLDPNHVVVASGRAAHDTNDVIEIRVTRDGGVTWESRTVGPAAATGGSDPFAVGSLRRGPRVAFDRFGTLYLAYEIDPVGSTPRIVLFSSADGGSTFAMVPGMSLNSDQSPPALATGRSALSPAREVILVAATAPPATGLWIEALATTGPGNLTSLGKVQVTGLQGQQPSVTIGEGGDVYVAWVEDLGGGNTAVKLDADLDGPEGGADDFTGPETTLFTNVGGPLYAIGGSPTPHFGAPVAPEVAVIRHGAHAGRVVVAFTRNANGGVLDPDLDVVSMVSDDFGATFTGLALQPSPVHSPSGVWQFGPALTADPTAADGRLLVSWYDARNGPFSAAVERHAAASVDGVHWGAPVLVSEPPFSSRAAITVGNTDDYYLFQGLASRDGCSWTAHTFALGGALDADVWVHPFQVSPP